MGRPCHSALQFDSVVPLKKELAHRYRALPPTATIVKAMIVKATIAGETLQSGNMAGHCCAGAGES